MKHLIIYIGTFCLWANGLFAQIADSIPVAIADMKEIPVYEIPKDSLSVVLTLQYAKPEIGNQEALKKIPAGYIPYQVELVYSKYPLDYNQWAMTYSGLMKARIQNLLALDKSLGDASVDWYLVLQTQCKTAAEAKAMFHGFVIKYRPKSQQPIVTRSESDIKEAPVPPVPYELSTEAALKVSHPKKVTEIYTTEEIKKSLTWRTQTQRFYGNDDFAAASRVEK